MLLSRTYCPSPSLAPYVRRFYVFEAPLPNDMVIDDFLLSETAFIRILIKGEWTGELAPGEWSKPGRTLFFGANARPLRVRVKGPFAVAGMALRPSGWRALFRGSHQSYADRLMRLDQVWGMPTADLEAEIDSAPDDAAKIEVLERLVSARLDKIGRRKVDGELARFEGIARTDPTRRIEEISNDLGLSMRQFARRCLTGFGITPKQVMRRSRFLDMATAMRGFSTSSEHDLAALRYYDQSHLGREFKRFAGMTPHVFAQAHTPLQTAGLKLREESKYED